jgi:hypothetical protein
MRSRSLRSKLAICPVVALTAVVSAAAGVAAQPEVSTGIAAHKSPVTPKVRLSLDRSSYQPGATATLRVRENVKAARSVKVADTSGATWRKVSDDGTVVVFKTTTTTSGGDITVTMRRSRDYAKATATTSYDVVTATWPGQRPGRVILGMSCGTVCAQREADLGQDYGVHRQYKNWGEWSAVAKDIREDHAAGRLPWISIKSPGGARGWQRVASGDHDAAIRDLATTLEANDDQPIILTFHHEPSNDGSEAQGVQWAAAYVHFHDVLDAAGALANVADVPIVGDWLFNPSNRAQDPENWVTSAVLRRAPFLGVDMYENASGDTYATRIPRITDWMAARGFPDKQVGIGETGSTNHYARSTAVQWMNDSLSWASAHPEQVGVISYFNSTANSRAGVYWPLDESPAKMAAYRGWLDRSVS